MKEVSMAATASRSVLGSLNDYTYLLEGYWETSATLLDVALRIADAPCGPLRMKAEERHSRATQPSAAFGRKVRLTPGAACNVQPKKFQGRTARHRGPGIEAVIAADKGAGWLPKANRPKERAYLFPHEEAAVLACTRVPLVWRLFFGFCAREGVRRENAVTLEWSNLTLDLPNGGGHIDLDTTKNGRGGNWPLDSGTAEALRRWQRMCPSDRWVFPAEALPRYRRRRGGLPLSAGHAGLKLREALGLAGQDRPKLFQRDVNRIQIRAHDLRATFVTLALANGKTEDWVTRRTGHSSSIMLARYRRDAETLREHDLGWLVGLHEHIPELKNSNAEPASPTVQLSGYRRESRPRRSRTPSGDLN
jgi:integrase